MGIVGNPPPPPTPVKGDGPRKRDQGKTGTKGKCGSWKTVIRENGLCQYFVQRIIEFQCGGIPATIKLNEPDEPDEPHEPDVGAEGPRSGS